MSTTHDWSRRIVMSLIKIQDILTIMPKLKGTMDSLSSFSANVNYYDRVKTD